MQFMQSFDMSTLLVPFKLWHPPPCILYNRSWAPERDRERLFLAIEGFLPFPHALLDSTTKGIDRLPWVTNTNVPTFAELSEHFMITRVEVLVFVNEDNGISWKCTSEQCGHIYLIVK